MQRHSEVLPTDFSQFGQRLACKRSSSAQAIQSLLLAARHSRVQRRPQNTERSVSKHRQVSGVLLTLQILASAWATMATGMPSKSPLMRGLCVRSELTTRRMTSFQTSGTPQANMTRGAGRSISASFATGNPQQRPWTNGSLESWAMTGKRMFVQDLSLLTERAFTRRSMMACPMQNPVRSYAWCTTAAVATTCFQKVSAKFGCMTSTPFSACRRAAARKIRRVCA
mmetsp:Transcript_62353/g.110813  ORF Transcript_62353/g.110813 Transcript_62353/m.110813 type:complete len:226 (+) Transcript_62353:1881-2558(+)